MLSSRLMSSAMGIKVLALILAAVAFAAGIPRTWEKAAVDTLELPLANGESSPTHIDEAAYYRISERVIYKSYPVYAPGREPAGYMERLKTVEPEIAFDSATLSTPQEWVTAGEIVFNAPTSFHPLFFTAQDLNDPDFFKKTGMPVAKDGTIPFARWVVRRKGVVELGSMGCATCHTRVLKNGTVVPGAPGNNPNDYEGALLLQASARVMGREKVLERVHNFARQFELPWVPDDINR